MAKGSRGYSSKKRDKAEKAVIIILALVMLVVAIVMISLEGKDDEVVRSCLESVGLLLIGIM
mgnify:CR=1 FL=1